MARVRPSPEYILPMRMTLHIPSDTPLRFSVLSFPYARALNTFMRRFEEIYKHQHGTKAALPFEMTLPFRQLNDALLALAPGLIQGFEGPGNLALKRMVAFTRYENNRAQDFPALEDITTLIRIWMERWAAQPRVAALLERDGKAAWDDLLRALDSEPETEWDHDKTASPLELANNPNKDEALGYLALPALLTALLHDRTMTIERPQGSLSITWRRAHDGEGRGLHLVSQPMPNHDDYFAYRLDFSVQTQAGYNGSWIFARLSIQRYIGERHRSDGDKRAISILVGHNRERFTGGWDTDITLIRLPVTRSSGKWTWESGVGALLDDYAIRRLEAPEVILNAPMHYGGYRQRPEGDEYYIVYAEGRKFSDKSVKGREHQTKTGLSLPERSRIMIGVLTLLNGWLETSTPFQKDIQNPANTLALRTYTYMIKQNKTTAAKQASWRAALETSLANSDAARMHLIVLYRADEFRAWAQAQLEETLMGADIGSSAPAIVTFVPMPLTLYGELDPGDFDPQICFQPEYKRPKGWTAAWRTKMRASYCEKRKQWQEFLSSLPWEPNARRLLLIDSTGEKGLPNDQKIKGAVRDACHRENILSQFIIGGDLKPDKQKAPENELDGGSAGKLQNAVLDLVVRQQVVLYASPCEIYERAAGLDAQTAAQLDVIAFCRVRRTKPFRFNDVLAVRLRATGEVDVILPQESPEWIPYDIAAHELGRLYSDNCVSLANASLTSRLRLGHKEMLQFVHDVLKNRLERPTIAVIEAEGWRNSRGWDEQSHCWTQLTNAKLFDLRHLLYLNDQRRYERSAPAFEHLLAVVRLRMDDETPQYVTAGHLNAEEMRDIPHLTGYVDLVVPDLLHYLSVARLPTTQKKQHEKEVAQAFRADLRSHRKKDIAVKHPQIIEMVPFFVHPRYQSDEGQRQLCRCVHFLRHSPSFTSGDTVLPYPMHLGEKLISDQLVIIGADS